MRALGLSTVLAVAAIAPALPPAPSTWPRYPAYPATSCWARPSAAGGGVLRSAPSYVTHPRHRAPSTIAAQLLARLGDTRFVKRIVLAPPPPVTRRHNGWFPHGQPPRNALWAYVSNPQAGRRFSAKPPAVAVQRSSIADWEGQLVFGALRDELCANGGPPLVGWSMNGLMGVSDAGQALGQRFPSPGPAAFRARLAAVARRYGFSVVSLRFVHALQLAPLVVVRTDRKPKAFVGDVAAIMQLLDPHNGTALTFEGFYFEAMNGKGPFVSVENVYRGEVMGGEWSANPCLYPYAHGGPIGQRC